MRNDSGPDTIRIADMVRALGEGKLVIASLAITGALAGLLVAFMTTPVYRSRALLVPVGTDDTSVTSPAMSTLGGFAALAGVGFGSNSSKANEAIALLVARAFTEEFIRANALMPVLFADSWDPAAGGWKSHLKRPPTIADGYRLFDRSVRTVTEDRRSGFVTLAIEWHDPAVAATWAQALIDSVNARMRERAITEAQHSLEFLRKELQQTHIVEVQQAIYRLMEVQIKTIMLANVRDQYSFRVIDPPDVPGSAEMIKPKRKLLLVLGCVSGLLLGAAFTLGRSALRAA